jgi:hypothetical protein
MSGAARKAALHYASLGWYVLPVDKHKKPIASLGLHSATNNAKTIEAIWGEYPDAGVAIACEKSGLVVVDVDPRNGGVRPDWVRDTLTSTAARNRGFKCHHHTFSVGSRKNFGAMYG